MNFKNIFVDSEIVQILVGENRKRKDVQNIRMSSTGPCCNCSLSLYFPCPEEKYQRPQGFCLHSLARTSPGLCLGVKSGVHHQAIDKHPKMRTSTCNSQAVLSWPSRKESRRIKAKVADWEAFQQAASLRIARTWRGLTSWGLLLVNGQLMQQIEGINVDAAKKPFHLCSSYWLCPGWIPKVNNSSVVGSKSKCLNHKTVISSWGNGYKLLSHMRHVSSTLALGHQMHQPSRWVEPLWESIDSIASIADLWWCWWNSQRTPGKGWHQRYSDMQESKSIDQLIGKL